MIEIFQCSCKNEFQDKTYGKGNRVMNPMGKADKISGYRCTVCGKEYRVSDAKRKK